MNVLQEKIIAFIHKKTLSKTISISWQIERIFKNELISKIKKIAFEKGDFLILFRSVSKSYV